MDAGLASRQRRGAERHRELHTPEVDAAEQVEIDVIDERDGGTLFSFADADGNGWVVQQIKARADTPLILR